MPLDKQREGRFGQFAFAPREPLEKLSIRQSGERPDVKKSS
jgi:hypothetical protein